MSFFKNYQKKILNYFFARQPQFLFLTFTAIFLLILGQLPFFNLILSPLVTLFLLWLIATAVLKPYPKRLFVIIVLLFLVCLFLFFLDRGEQAEDIGVAIFAFLVLAVGQSLKDLLGKYWQK